MDAGRRKVDLRSGIQMSGGAAYSWAFRARFKRHAYGWRSSQKAVGRIKEAVTEIKQAARKDPALGAEGAILFFERLSPAIEHVDSSSGALGSAVYHGIDSLVPVISGADVEDNLREKWLDRLWRAVEEDEIPYLEGLPEYWGELCVSRERASRWADSFIETVRLVWSPDPNLRGYFKGTAACLSALLKAERYDELLDLVDMAPYRTWHYRRWAVQALVAKGEKGEAVRYAEDSRGLNENPAAIAHACEEILLSSGLYDEAFSRYAVEANRKTTYLATFRALVKKYPSKDMKEILDALVASTPGEEGKWFAAAKSAALYAQAIELANRTPCDPRTLTRAARDMKKTEPDFALEAGMAALKWLTLGYGYDIVGADVLEAYDHTMHAAENAGKRAEALTRLRALISRSDDGVKDFSGYVSVVKLIASRIDADEARKR